ncbi:isopenicillin N synthase family dioxygenase [Celeribacter indicus]|uniref:2OG-Fe(II) oxygenase n=1 Tax=Celeribacter indicus TaxID=1208324 RepID=A0A0B5DXG4_9RHOB|nr:2-oxoglutarate and iron-dependent oxygenase domain-containing protein [Celeribacter indicus]AJE45446.1 2OG-Fe(II) oxygenase [Celeribacter indicus]SDX02203.1 Isopenicillin N synthase [Celeribacter indicus]
MIPVLNWQLFVTGKDPDAFTASLGAACRTNGIFLLSDHGIPRGLLAEVREASDAFFALPEAEKSQLDIRRSKANRGWAGVGVEITRAHLRKESFSMGLDLTPEDPRVLAGEPFRAPNLWPEIDTFRDAMRDYYKEMLGLGRFLLKAVERDLELPAGFFQPHFSEPMATLRLSHYHGTPPAELSPEARQGPAQTDYGSLTVVLTDGASGLQVLTPRGEWVDLPEIPGTLAVLVGDCLMRWSNDQYRAAAHRILTPETPRRLAAFYLDPNPDSLIAPLPRMGPPNYAPVRAADYLRARLDETYLSAEAAQ